MQVTSTGPNTIQIAKGDRVTLGCTFSSAPSDTGVLDVEWSNVNPDMTQKDQLVSITLKIRICSRVKLAREV